MNEALNQLTIDELKKFEREKVNEIYWDLKKYFPEIRFEVELTIEYYIYDKDQ
jgi:hypothetical protein